VVFGSATRLEVEDVLVDVSSGSGKTRAFPVCLPPFHDFDSRQIHRGNVLKQIEAFSCFPPCNKPSNFNEKMMLALEKSASKLNGYQLCNRPTKQERLHSRSLSKRGVFSGQSPETAENLKEKLHDI
jgi:hypothetical protein